MARFHLRLALMTVVHGLFSPYSSTQSLIINYFQPFIQPFVNQSFYDHFGQVLNPSQFSWLWSSVAAMHSVGTLLGALAITYFLERFGRRDTVMVFRNSLAIFAGCIQATAKPLNSFEILAFGHLLTGICSALNAGLILYITECSPDRYRGIITLITGIGGRLLVLMASVLALPTVFGNDQLWPYFSIVAALPAFIHLLFAFLPKSPKFLYFSTRLSESPQLRREQSMKSIKFYHGDDVDSSEVISRYDKEAELGQFQYGATLSHIWQTRQLRIPFLICIVAATAPAFSGLTMRDQYSNGMLVSFGVPAESTMSAFILLHSLSIPFCVLAPFLVEKLGRRPLLLACITMALFSLFGMFYAELSPGQVGTAVGLVGFAFGTLSAIFGILSVPYLLMGEMCPQVSRSKTTSISIAVSICCTLTVVFVFPPMNDAIGPYSYLPIAAIEMILLGILWKYLPETKNMSVDQIVAQFKDNQEINSNLNEKSPLLIDGASGA